MSRDTSKVADFLTPADAARALGINISAVYLAIKDGRLATTEVLGKTVIRRSDVETYTPRPNKRRRAQPEKLDKVEEASG